MMDEMERHWRKPEHVPNDQHSLWAVERVWGRLLAECKQSSNGSVELSDAAKILREIVEPMRRRVEEQGFDGFDTFLARHRCPAPEFGPHRPQPSLAEHEAEHWWLSKTPIERYVALTGSTPDSCDDIRCAVLVGFGKVGESVAAVSASADWKDIPESQRTILLANMRKGWVRMPETIRSS